MSGTSMVVVFHGRVYISGPTDMKYPLVIDIDSVVITQVIVEL